jgi:hypothetical protein
MTETPNIQDIAPVASQEALLAAIQKTFQSTLRLPKDMNRFMIGRAVDRVLLERVAIEELGMGLLRSEREYITKVVSEFKAWQETHPAPQKVTV